MASTSIIKEDDASTQDVTVLGIATQSRFVLATALLAAGSPLYRTKVIEVQIEYESLGVHAALVEFSLDGGTTWGTFSLITFQPTTGPSVLSCRKTLTHHNLQLRLRSATLGRLRILSFIPHIVLEGKVRP